jgi:fibronectin-binding autotransporter adhesin
MNASSVKTALRVAVRTLSFMLIGLAAAGTISAGTISSWSGASSQAWSANLNWVGGAANKPSTSGTSSLVFSGTPANTTSNNNVGVVNIDSILFSNDGSASQASAFTVRSSTSTNILTLINGATVTTTAISGTTLKDTISAPLTLSGTTTFNLGASHSLELTGSISGGGTLVKQGAADLSITAAATIAGGFGGMTIDSGTVTLLGTDKVTSLDGRTVKVGGATAATLNFSLGNTFGYSETSTANFQMGNDATVQLTNNNSNNLRFTAADFNVANAAVTAAKTLTFTGGGTGNLQTVTIDGVVRDNSTNGIVNVAFLGKNNYVLTNSSTYTGTTSVTAGVLVNGTLASPTVTVNSTGYLGGSGQLSGLVTVLSGGTLSPGGTSSGSTLSNSVATLTVGGLSLNSDATTNLSVSGTTAGGLFDQVAFTGGSPSLTYGGLLNLTLSGSYADQTSFGLFSGFTSQTGSFSSIALSAVGTDFDGKTFEQDGTSGDWYTGWTANNQQLKFSQSTGTLTVVPEPSTIVFAAIGIAMFGWSTWTRRRAEARRQVMEAAAAS